ncbi:Fe-S oxidoreductase [Treponema primitia ZAS-2]|uniref:Fe-S oxidoreductase n=1 Tax=Treponema primitia (strain ATCC BAA-887 / DSM 12427 / ZAS-2) TaxID=545694 RepID=F5YPR3_TREPZ|nr:aldo/keto reductase [Treponema primitia]AEF85760.1 Fe-S oxidoreductase [Treponema primitia ZAS-2]
MVEKRLIKKSGEELSLLGFGLMRLPLKPGTKDIDKALALEMVDYAKNKGINYFDTAYVYHEGNSELFAGEALSRYDRNSYNLASKMPLMVVRSEADVERIFEEQLKKCRVEYFDYYLLHSMNVHHLKIAEDNKVYEQLKEKQRQGKIRRLGFSFHDAPEVLTQIVAKWDWDFAQIQLNYLDWEQQDAKGQYKILNDKGIPVTVMEPVRGGSLASLGDEADSIFKAADPKASVSSWAIRFAATLPGVQVVLSGMSNLDQMKDNISTMENFKPINEADQKVIDKAVLAFRTTGAVPCTGCRYCMECPQGVDIPRNLALYNAYLFNKERNRPNYQFGFMMEYNGMGKAKQAQNCVECKQCEEKCPQHIEISKQMGLIQEVNKTVTASLPPRH